MAHTILIHIAGEEPITAEVEELPKPGDNLIIVTGPRRRDGKDIHYIDTRAVKVIWPMHKISFIEVLSGEESEEIISFVRE